MVRSNGSFLLGPRRFAAARFACVLFFPVALCVPTAPAAAQVAAVDTLTAHKLIWSTLVALDQANATGNYSVLRDLAAPGFQAANSPATLAGTFQALRAQNVDLSNCLILAPTFQFPPTIVQGGMLRMRGTFQFRPTGIAFDMLFMNVEGQWRLFGLAVVPAPSAAPPTVGDGPRSSQNGSTRR